MIEQVRLSAGRVVCDRTGPSVSWQSSGVKGSTGNSWGSLLACVDDLPFGHMDDQRCRTEPFRPQAFVDCLPYSPNALCLS